VSPQVTISGVNRLFFVGCQSFASSGLVRAKLCVIENLLPAQKGQPVLEDTLSFGEACHSWSGPTGHRHQTFLLLCGKRSSGRSWPFFSLCHCFARSGYTALREVSFVTLLPAQNGHREPAPTLFDGVACQMCSEFFRHCHQYLTPE
jgi:hypothetical protein